MWHYWGNDRGCGLLPVISKTSTVKKIHDFNPLSII
jgi:hypothetical protein